MVKVDIISGFLGAGKTTLIQKLFSDCFGKEKIVLIENEFGEIGIDGSFLKESGVAIKEINSGCICCSLVGDFTSSMKEVVDKFSPDRIIIEPSGVGKLSDIIRAVEKTGLDLKINIVATVADAGKCKMYYKNFGEFYNDQVKEANTVVLSKTDKLSDEKIKAAAELIREINPKATIITTPVIRLEGEKLLEALESDVSMVDELLEELNKEPEHEHHHHHHHHDDDCCCGHHHDGEGHHHHHDHDADEVFGSWGKETVLSYLHTELDSILQKLCDDMSLGVILRSKGIVRASDNEKWYYFDLVAGDYEIRTGAPDVTGRVVVIGSKLEKQKIEKLFDKE